MLAKLLYVLMAVTVGRKKLRMPRSARR